MNEEAYEKLIEALKKDELDWFIESRGDYIVLIPGMPGEPHTIDYNAMYAALSAFVEQYPDQKAALQEKLLEILQTGYAGTVRAFIELVYRCLNYDSQTLGFVNDQIIFELQRQIKEHEEDLKNMRNLKYQQKDEMAFRMSGRHFI